jgi:hypothetical protein
MEGLQRDNTIGVNAFIAINSRIVGHSEVETPSGVKFSTYGLLVTRAESREVS